MTSLSHKVEIPLSHRDQIYEDLLAINDGSANGIWLAQIMASWLVGEGVLPNFLGLHEHQFNQLLAKHFSGYRVNVKAPSGKVIDFRRMLEKQDMEQLLRKFAKEESEENECLIAIIVAGCQGNDHLWQDLGLWSRKDLTAFLSYNFPKLAELNNKDMKWKKFLYKQLCETEGLYICRAPSCGVCKDYSVCFGAEE